MSYSLCGYLFPFPLCSSTIRFLLGEILFWLIMTISLHAISRFSVLVLWIFIASKCRPASTCHAFISQSVLCVYFFIDADILRDETDLFKALQKAQLDSTGKLLTIGDKFPVVGNHERGGDSIFIRQAHRDIWSLLEEHVLPDAGFAGVVIKGPVGVGKVIWRAILYFLIPGLMQHLVPLLF